MVVGLCKGTGLLGLSPTSQGLPRGQTLGGGVSVLAPRPHISVIAAAIGPVRIGSLIKLYLRSYVCKNTKWV